MQKQKNKTTTLSERGRPWRFEMITMNNKNNTFFLVKIFQDELQVKKVISRATLPNGLVCT